jgi:hypothetical protein
MRWLLFFFPIIAFPAYVGNLGNPAIMNSGLFSGGYPFMKATSGYIYDYTSNKRYVAQQGDLSFDPNSTFREFGLHSQLATFSFIFVERLEIFGTAGGSKEQAKGERKPSFLADFSADYNFSWSAGTKVILLQWGQTFLSMDFTYFTIPSAKDTFIEYIQKFNLPFTFGKQSLHLREWQLSGGLSSKFYFFTPYAGVTYLRSRLHIESTNQAPAVTYVNQMNWGYFFGFTISLTGKFHVNFERRLRDEFAYTFSTIAVF